MDTNRCHRASEDALEAPRMAIAVPDELQESEGAGTDELQERGTEALYGRVWQFGELPANHRAGGCALERCLEGFAVLNGHKLVPSRELMCPGAMSGGVRGARWTQIGAIGRAKMPWRPLEWRLPCQMNCRKVWDRALTAVCGSSESFRQIIARADVPWSDVWRGSRCSMDTNQCHRASGYALERCLEGTAAR